MNRKMYTYTDYRGGISEKDPDNMADNDLTAADNIELSSEGGFTYRAGTKNINFASYGGDTRQILEFPLSDGTIKTLAVIDSAGVYKLCDVTNGNKVELLTLMAPKIGYVVLNNRIFFSDQIKYYSYGDYQYNTQIGTVTIKTGDIVKNAPISTHATQPGILNHFYKAVSDLGSIDLKTTDLGNATKWLDVTSGCISNVIKEVVGKVDETNDIAPIKKCKYFIYHTKSHRIFASGNPDDKTALYFSEPDDPTFFKATNKMYPTMGDGVIKGLKQVVETVVVGYGHSWWGWEGTDPLSATWGRYPIPHGLLNDDAFVLTPGSWTFLSNDGIYTVSTAVMNRDIIIAESDGLITKISDNKVDKIIAKIKNPSHVSMVFYDSKLYLSYSYSNIDPHISNYALMCYWNTKSFTRITGWRILCFYKTLMNELIFGSTNYILKVDHNELNDIDLNGNVKGIHIHLETKSFNFHNPINQKIFHNFFIWSSQNVDAGNTINLTLKIDFSDTSFPIDLNSEIFIWGQTWGNVWGFADIAPQMALLHKKGIRCKVIFDSEDINTRNNVIVYGVAFEVEHLRARARTIAYKP